MNEYERIYKRYTYGDLVGIIQSFAEVCSDRSADADFACDLGDKYDPIFNYDPEVHDEEDDDE
jgi:hypothetical protein